MYRIKHRLAQKTAALMSAVLLFTAGADTFAPIAEVMAADEVTVSEEGVSGAEIISPAEFTVSAAQIQYGEDGSNKKGNLDALFTPCLKIDGSELAPGAGYSISYKFFTDKETALAVDAGTFDAAQGEILSEIPAGTGVYALACAETCDARYLALTELTIAKRKISINYESAEDNAVEGRDVSENGIYVVPESDIDYSGFNITAEDGFAYDLDAGSLLAGDIMMDLSGVDLSVDSVSDVPMEVKLDPVFDDNYELDKNIHGNLYIHKAKYYVVFLANNNGETYTKTYALPDYKYSGTVTELLTQLGKTEEILHKTEDGKYDLNGFINVKSEALTGWTVYADGFNASHNQSYSDYEAGYSGGEVILNPDATTYEGNKETKSYHMSGSRDYLFVAQISKAAAGNVFVSAIPAVLYDSREHVALGTKANLKKQVPDLRIKVNYTYNGDPNSLYHYTELIPGTDYTIKYYNNVNASMKVSEDGTYVPVKTGDDRPRAELKGKGKYNGFSATVYFDILPVNLSETEYAINFIHERNDNYEDGFNENPMDKVYTSVESYYADVKGLEKKHTYVLKNGKISGINFKVTKGFRVYANGYDGSRKDVRTTVNLVKNKDYVLEIYKYNKEVKCWELQEGITDPNKVTTVGQYLILVRGIGNFCGARFDFWDRENFNVGNNGYYPNPSLDISSEFQFIVTDSPAADLTYSTIKVGKRSIDYDGNYHGANDFGIVVKDKDKNVLVYNEDYIVEFRSKYHKIKFSDKNNGVRAANVYSVTIYGIGDYYGEKTTKNVTVKGLKLRKDWFTRYDDWIKLSDKGVAAGLTMDNDADPYFVNAVAYSKKGYAIFEVGGEYTGAAIDPAKPVIFRMKIPKMPKIDKITLKDAIEQGLIKFEVSEKGAYNINGTMPREIQIISGTYPHYTYESQLYDGYSINGMGIYNKDGKYIGGAALSFSFKNNKKVGASAQVVVKVLNSNILKGSAVVGSYTVEARNIDELRTYSPYDTDTMDTYYGLVYGIITNGRSGKGSLDKPQIKLYQCGLGKDGKLKSVPLGSKQYTVHKGKERGIDHIAAEIYITGGSQEGYIFADVYETDDKGTKQGVSAGRYYLYDKQFTAKVIDAVSIGGVEYPVKNGVIGGSFAPVFTGKEMNIQVDSIRIGDKTYKLGRDYEARNGREFAAGAKAGSITINTMYNSGTDSFDYGGSAVIKYNISPAEGVKL